jgi:hypothetical protein
MHKVRRIAEFLVQILEFAREHLCAPFDKTIRSGHVLAQGCIESCSRGRLLRKKTRIFSTFFVGCCC